MLVQQWDINTFQDKYVIIGAVFSHVIHLHFYKAPKSQRDSVSFYAACTGSPGMGSGPRVPFQRAMSMDAKPPGGPGGAGRRPMLVKQENMMGSPDSYPGNMGVCLCVYGAQNLFTPHISSHSFSASVFLVCVPQFLPLTVSQFNLIILKTKTGLNCSV